MLGVSNVSNVSNSLLCCHEDPVVLRFQFHSANGSVERVEWHSLTQWSRRAQFHRRGQTDFSYRTWSAWTQITTKLVLHGLWALKSFSAVHMQRPVFSIHCRFAQAILILCFGAGFCVIALVCLRPCGPSEPRFKEVALVKTAGFVQKSCDCSRMVTFTLFSACCDPFFCHWKSVIWMIFHIRLHLSKEICWLICFFACLFGILIVFVLAASCVAQKFSISGCTMAPSRRQMQSITKRRRPKHAQVD